MSDETTAQTYRARAFYHWKKPGEKERHGFAMGMVTAAEKTNESVTAALKAQGRTIVSRLLGAIRREHLFAQLARDCPIFAPVHEACVRAD